LRSRLTAMATGELEQGIGELLDIPDESIMRVSELRVRTRQIALT
jgi:hypothetical protein